MAGGGPEVRRWRATKNMKVMLTFWQRGGRQLGILLGLAFLAGCATGNPGTKTARPAPGMGATATGLPVLPPVTGTNAAQQPLRNGDMVTVSFPDMPKGDSSTMGTLECRERIRDDGTIILPYHVVVQAAGKTVTQLQDAIHDAYVPKYYTMLTVSVKGEDRVYYVGGEVKIPNRYGYVGETTVLRAIDSAGGLTDFANKKTIELRRENGELRIINYDKARKNPSLDPKVYPNDQIIVRQRLL